MLYFKLVASLLHMTSKIIVLLPIFLNFFTRSEQVHSYSTRFSVAGSFYIISARTNHQLLSFSRVGAKIWNGILEILETEEMNVDMCYIDLSSFPAFSLTC